MDTSQCCRLIPHLLVQTKNVATLITTLYRIHYKWTRRLLHPLLWNTYAASTVADIYICNIHCCGLHMLHPLLWNIYATSTAVEYVCFIHCCGIYLCYIHCGGIYMLHPLLWNIRAAPTAVDYLSVHHHFRGGLQCPRPWTCARLPMLWMRVASSTCHW